MLFAYTSIYAGLLGLFSVVLSLWVIRNRWVHRVSIGTNGNQQMEKAMRVHANFHEYIPFALILMAMAETREISIIWIHTMGSLLIAGRVLHWIGLIRYTGSNPFRFLGMVITFTVLSWASLYLLFY